MRTRYQSVTAIKNIFSWDGSGAEPGREFVEFLIEREGVTLERIISRGHVSEPGHWYDQETDEWVVLLKGRASLEFEGGRIMHLTAGDFLMLPAGLRHRVTYTSKTPPCVWLALHLKP